MKTPISVLLAVLTSLLVGFPACADTPSQASVVPPEPHLFELSREDRVRAVYQTVEENLRAAGHELTLDVRRVETIYKEQFDQYRAYQLFTMDGGASLHIHPQRSSTEVQMPDGSRREIDRFVTFELEWKPNYWLMNADPERKAIFDRISSQTFAEYVENGKDEDETLRNVAAVTSAEIELDFRGNQRVYRAAFFWYSDDDTVRTFLLVDRVLIQLERALDPEHPVRPTSALGDVPDLPAELRKEVENMRGETSQQDYSSLTCNALWKQFSDHAFKQGFEEHSDDGQHQSSVDITYTCSCAQDCTSKCTPEFGVATCNDFDPIAAGRRHVSATDQDTLNGTKPEATDTGATCSGAFGCVLRSCKAALPCGVSVSVIVSGGELDFDSSGATYGLNSRFELQGGCPACEVDTSGCLNLGGDLVCGSEPEPIESDDCSGDTCTPIVIDLARNGFDFTGFDAWVKFDIDADGTAERITWTDPNAEDAFLALDRNGNGLIDDGSELFGDSTQQPETEEPNGFLALSVFDEEAQGGNGDGVITEEDAIFPSLRVWKDENQDAKSQPSELRSLDDAGIYGIQLAYFTMNRQDRYGNMLHWTSFVQFADRGHLAAADVMFVLVPEGIE